jgi:hypothetical protein
MSIIFWWIVFVAILMMAVIARAEAMGEGSLIIWFDDH